MSTITINDRVSQKPLQRLTWNQKIADDYKYFKNTALYYISRGGTNLSLSNGDEKTGGTRGKIAQMYDVYNNRFPQAWFSHVLNPLAAKKKEHKAFGAKMRPTGILRTNLDLLMGEYPRRPFIYQVLNLGEDGYNSYLNKLNEGLINNLTQHFVAQAQIEAQNSGVPMQQQEQPEQIELPESFQKKFKSSYKDNIAIKCQHWLKRAIKEYHIRPEQFKMFKDYIITGYVHSYKGVEKSSLVYNRIPIEELKYDTLDGNEYVEDKEWVVREYYMNYSDIVDEFYDELKEKDHKQLETSVLESPESLAGFLRGKPGQIGGDLQLMYHVVWKGKIQKAILYYQDELTGEAQSMEVGEDYIPDPSTGEYIEKFWANEWYETTLIGKDIFVRMRPIPIQRNEMNNLSRTKGPYNGRAFSNTNSDNISVMEIGLPFQLMHMIIQYSIEKTINKNKGKIALMDRNAIPRDEGWDEEKFIYYADATGWAFMNRAQEGVDKTMNQYHVLDMSLYESIEQLINLQDKIKQQWDDILGITRQRKGQTYASDSVQNNQDATFRSTVITDTIFSGFDEFIEREYQGILDLSKFVNVDGVRKVYNNDDFTTELLEIDPHEYTNADLGIYFAMASKEQENLEAFKANMQAFIQNGMKGSTVVEVLQIESLAELKQNLLHLEEIEAKMQQQQQDAEGEQKQEADQRLMQLEEFRNQLKLVLDNNNNQAKLDQIDLQATYDMELAGMESQSDLSDSVVTDTGAIDKNLNDRLKLLADERAKNQAEVNKKLMQVQDLTFKYTELAAKERMNRDNNKTKLKNPTAGESKKK